MIAILRPAATLLAVFTVLTGLAYPLAMTGVIQLAFPDAANGSLVRKGDAVVGSSLIGQNFAADGYFHSRPSAAGQNGYDAAASSGSNLGPLSKKLNDRIAASVAGLKSDGANTAPADAVTTSGSGLDPHISPAYALIQVGRVARSRGVDDGRIRAILEKVSEKPSLGLFGESRVNVLLLNLALDTEIGKGTS